MYLQVWPTNEEHQKCHKSSFSHEFQIRLKKPFLKVFFFVNFGGSLALNFLRPVTGSNNIRGVESTLWI